MASFFVRIRSETVDEGKTMSFGVLRVKLALDGDYVTSKK